jgi:2-keto-3-deoxy-L-rhamnonate aldolase RhmA
MGIPGQFQHPDYLAAVRRVVAAAAIHGKHAGFMAADEQWAREYWGHGFRMMAYGRDQGIYQAGLKAGLDLLGNLAGDKA